MSKKFSYGKGDEADTDAFISSTLKSAPKSEQMELQTGAFNRGGDGSYYSVDTGAGRLEYPNRCSRILVYLFAAVIFIFGIALMVLGGVEKKKGILPICPNCDKIITVCFAAGAVFLVYGLVGVLAAHTRNTCIAVIFGFILVQLVLIGLGGGIAFIVIEKGSHLVDIWKAAVKNDPSAICTVQNRLGCSGYDTCCYFVNSSAGNLSASAAAPSDNFFDALDRAAAVVASADEAADLGNASTTTVAPGTTAAPAPTNVTIGCQAIYTDKNTSIYQNALAMCVPTCSKYANPCGPKLKKDLKNLLVPVAGIFFPLGIISILIIIATKRMLSTSS